MHDDYDEDRPSNDEVRDLVALIVQRIERAHDWAPNVKAMPLGPSDETWAGWQRLSGGNRATMMCSLGPSPVNDGSTIHQAAKTPLPQRLIPGMEHAR